VTDQFNNYAHSYDTIYEDKDYEAECDFVERIFDRYGNSFVKDVLDLGCGTCGHALPLIRRGYHVTGIDQSKKMLSYSRKKSAEAGLKITLIESDIRTLELNEKFDAVLSMFAVMSYQTTNADLSNAFGTASKHLKPNGLFIFDGWHGPAVLAERPGERVKELVKENNRIIRLTRPALNVLEQTVDVHFKVLSINGSRLVSEVDEVHTMRFLFAKEIEYYLEKSGFELIKFCPFMRLDDELTEHDWNIATIARKR